MVKRVFYIEKEKFLRSMMEFALRAKNVEIHTVETLLNNTYLLYDLTPDLVIFDYETLRATPDELSLLYQYCAKEKAKLIITAEDSKLSELDPIISGVLEKPIKASHLAERIIALID